MAKKEDTTVSNAPVVAQQAATPAVAGSMDDLNAWGAPNITAQDIIIPRLLTMQPMSDFVTKGDKRIGDIVDSLTQETLMDKNGSLEFVPFYMSKTWVEYDVTNGDDIKNKKFLRILPITPQNESLPYKDEEKNEKGQMIKVMRDRCMNFYVLLTKDLKGGAPIPYVFTARRSSSQAGKALSTQMFVKNVAAQKPPPAVTMKLTVSLAKDENTYFVPAVEPVGATPSEYVKIAFDWYKRVSSGGTQIDEASFDEGGEVAQNMGSNVDLSKGPAQF